jgi:hypothetical protein
LLCHTQRAPRALVQFGTSAAPSEARDSNHAATLFFGWNSPHRRARDNSITTLRRARAIADAKVTVHQLEEFGFFSGLRARVRADIILARFDPRF